MRCGDTMKIIKIILVISVLFLFGCQKEDIQLYSQSFVGPFDTVTQYMSYAQSEEEFLGQCTYIEERLHYYDSLFDRFHLAKGMNNVKTINDHAGIEPVHVDQALLDVIEQSMERYHTLSNRVNIGLGAVTDIWHRYRQEADNHNGIGKAPLKSELLQAGQHTSIENIVVDKQAQTVFLKDPKMLLDVGAVAKGYAMECLKDELISHDVDNFLLSGGGNVVSHGRRKIRKEGNFDLDACHDYFCVGIQSPFHNNNIASLIVKGESVVTSGNYQRYYEDRHGHKFHHLIDPETFYPAQFASSVTVVCEDSGLADYLSSALFLMPYAQGKEKIESLDNVEAIWIFEDGQVKMSSGLILGENISMVE